MNKDEDTDKESDLYKTLALNDTIHDFGKGNDRGIDINPIRSNDPHYIIQLLADTINIPKLIQQ